MSYHLLLQVIIIIYRSCFAYTRVSSQTHTQSSVFACRVLLIFEFKVSL